VGDNMKWKVLLENETGVEIVKMDEIIEKAFLVTILHQKIKFFGEVSVVIVRNDEMQEINNTHRGKNTTTDVLSFPQYEPQEIVNIPSDDYIVLGDIVLNIEKVQEQADEYSHSITREIGFLVVHSTLHLLGYDHETGHKDENEMFFIQEEILTQMGITRGAV